MNRFYSLFSDLTAPPSSLFTVTDYYDTPRPEGSKSYPPFDKYASADGTKIKFEIALAGYASSDIEVALEGDNLIVKGNKAVSQDTKQEWVQVHKGIAKRKFEVLFSLPFHSSEFTPDASMNDGILTVVLTRKEDDSKKRIRVELK